MVTNVVGHVVGGDRTNSIEQALTNAVESLTNAVGYQEKMLNIALEAPASSEAVCIKINNNTLSSVSTAPDSRVPLMMTYYHASKEESSQIHTTNVVRPSASKAYNGNGFVNNNMPEETSQLCTTKTVPVLPKKSSVPLNTSNYSSTNINMLRSFQLYNTATEVVQQPSVSGINNNN